ncbi:MAG: cupin domain-containing protein [Gammaproteobacteria bacterium]
MDHISIEHNVSPAKLDVLYVDDWPVWSKEISEFDWEYDKTETCYIVEGKAVVTPDNGEAVTIESGDMVIFPKGMKCHWKIVEPLEKHYHYD